MFRPARRALSTGPDGTRVWPLAGRGQRGRWWAVALAVAAAHLLLLSLLQRMLVVSPPAADRLQAPLQLVWVRPLPSPPEPLPAAAPPRTAEANALPRRAAAAPAAPRVETASAPSAPPAAIAASAASAPVTAAASAPDGGSLLDSDASRRAIRDAARQRSMGEMGAQVSGEPAPANAQDRLGQEIARGARGDCLKGEFAGSGMGLLSLPFWVIAELRDKCRR
jgi:hypothetical protein